MGIGTGFPRFPFPSGGPAGKQSSFCKCLEQCPSLAGTPWQCQPCWAVPSSSLGAPLYHYLKPNRLKGSESGFSGSPHALREGFLSAFSSLTNLGCVLSSGNLAGDFLMFRALKQHLILSNTALWDRGVHGYIHARTSINPPGFSNPGEENSPPIEKTKHKLQGLTVLAKVLTSDAFWK